MHKFWFFLAAISSLSFIASSCNVREINNSSTYIKNYNFANEHLSEITINKVSKINSDYEAIMHAPLIEWKFTNKAKFDSINNNFYESSFKYLNFGLASSIILHLNNGEIKEYSKDNIVDFPSNSNSKFGIIQTYNDEQNNINSHDFFENLSKATKVEFILKKYYYVNYKNEKVNRLINASDYWNSLKKDFDNVNNLFDSYYINRPLKEDFTNNIVFNNSHNSPYFKDFLLNEIPNNLIFNPLPFENQENNIKTFLFSSYYILNSNELDKQVFFKNEFYPNYNFRFSENTLKKIIFKYNSFPIDNSIYNFKQSELFKQNLVSEIQYDTLNQSQKTDVDNNPLSYGITYQNSNSLSNNTNKIFLNKNLNDINKEKNNFLFLSLFYGNDYFKDLNKNFYNLNSLKFRNYLIEAINIFSFNYLNNNSTYFNSISPQNLVFKNSFRDIKISDLVDNVNVDYIFDKNKLIFLNKYELENNYQRNLIDNYEALKNPYLSVIKVNMTTLIDNFYNEFQINKNEKIVGTLPIFDEYSYSKKLLYDQISKIINSLDERLNIQFEFCKKNSKEYVYQYKDLTFQNNYFSFYLLNLLTDKNIDLKNVIDNLKEVNNIDFNNITIKPLIKIKEIYESSTNNLDFENKINNLTINEQFIFLKAIDYLLQIPLAINSISINMPKKVLVQIQFIKPLNDLGYTKFQDIETLI
ncbi:hypothetical protein MM26B8_03900 [Mycoplasmopsis meleagridis]|uniref:Lipoprotein n=1 Tax=Mycoplasmopsis meleagridis ATCC 25294 TaxID=1264554 RepID=A0A0F5H0I6_9BACT|nr:hypothetical protein [Mycoplasmopsis meleagridis]KKB26794.1 hypothetical protein MMELEA_01850 [Mycoplasmopsis meleagridis ATCC 25294]OAD18089.1 hypothetical protein MM26B8_03900 [Mycoplasmopsis meleagridis]VEU77329.1 Uncharacterised protein [Mycoplasmopsis meleagridis]